MSDMTTVLMGEAEARAITDQIKENLYSTRALLLEMHERKGYLALGYDSWREYAQVANWFTKSDQHELDEIFRERGFAVEPTTPEQERGEKLGDRVFSKDGKRWFVEYKSDESASKTGNAFVETISVDSQGVPGWAHTCRADFIMYYLPLDGLIYVFRPRRMRKLIPKWEKKYPTRPTSKGQNKGYNTHGILVPLREFEKRANMVINL